MEKSPVLKTSIRLFKILVFFASAYFIFQVSQENLSALQNITFGWQATLLVLASIVVYVLLMMTLVLAWIVLLSNTSPLSCAEVYFKSQVLKYLPGNVFHFAYRHAESRKIGLSHKQLIQASIYESIGLIIAAVIMANALFLWSNQIPLIMQWFPLPLWTVLLIQLFGLILLTVWIEFDRIYRLLACYLCYFFGMGLIALGIMLVFNFQPQPYFFVTACFAISWLVGYVIPGAPGGLGVRETIFILLTSPQITESEALVLIAMIRLISIAAEAFVYFFAPILSQPYHRLAAWSGKTKP